MKLILPIFLFFFFSCQLLFSQTEKEIKLSGNFYYGEGVSNDLQEAKNSAKKELISNLSQKISVETSQKVSDSNNGFSSDYRSDSKGFSAFNLKGVKFIEKSEGKSHRTLAYISLEDYKKSVDETAASVIQNFELGLNSLRNNDYLAMLNSYQVAYLHTFYSPSAIQYKDADGKIVHENLQFVLKGKISEYLTKVKIETSEPYLVDQDILIPIKATYEGKNADMIIARIDALNSPELPVKGGKVELPIFTAPSKVTENFDIFLTMDFDTKANADLADMYKEYKISNTKNVEVDFSNFIKFDIKANKKDNTTFEFSFTIKNLNLSSIEWDLGDGTTSDEMKFLHSYPDESERKISLKLNGKPKLTKTIIINENSQSASKNNVTGKNSLEIKQKEKENQKQKDILDAKQKEKDALAVKEKEFVNKVNTQETTEPVKKENTEIKSNESSNAETPSMLPVIKELSACKTFQELKQMLDKYKNSGKLMYGKKETFSNPENCYIFVFSPDTKEVKAALSSGAKRYNFINNTLVSDIVEQFKGNAMIWVQIM